MFCVPEIFRIRTGIYKSDAKHGNNGAFSIKYKFNGITQNCFAIASDQMDWEHVSVSRIDRCLTWEEMCIIKDLFWSKDECVVQYHPAESEYINNSKYCLHLWKPLKETLPKPPSILIGV